MNRREQIELLSRRIFFDPSEKQLVRISPDGRWIAFQAPIDGVLNLWLAPTDEPEIARPLTNYTDREIGPVLSTCHFAPSRNHPYEAAATLGRWDRAAPECDLCEPRRPQSIWSIVEEAYRCRATGERSAGLERKTPLDLRN